MARPKHKRVIQQPPKIRGFKPIGHYSSGINSLELNLEEYEAIRLLDYENLTQKEAAEYMQISRPTLTRIYETARTKLSTMLVEAKQLVIEGGQYIFKNSWYECQGCLCKFNNPSEKNLTECIICGDNNIMKLEVVK